MPPFSAEQQLQASLYSQRASRFHKAKAFSVVHQFPWQDFKTTRLSPEELSGWSFQSWHDKHTDIDLTASPSALCLFTFLQQQASHQADSPHILYILCITGWIGTCEKKVLTDGPYVTSNKASEASGIAYPENYHENLCMIQWLSSWKPA